MPWQRTGRVNPFTLRRYTAADEDAAIELWRRTWQHHYPHLNFTERVPGGASVGVPNWCRRRASWSRKTNGEMVGFVTVDPQTMYLDQIVVAPEHWGSASRGAARGGKRLSPRGLELLVNKDNTRAIHFYEKHGFKYAGEDKNPVSGKPVNRMAGGHRPSASAEIQCATFGDFSGSRWRRWDICNIDLAFEFDRAIDQRPRQRLQVVGIKNDVGRGGENSATLCCVAAISCCLFACACPALARSKQSSAFSIRVFADFSSFALATRIMITLGIPPPSDAVALRPGGSHRPRD